MANEMNAVRFHAFGGPDVLVHEKAPIPEPGPGEVLIKAHAAAINPIDLSSRAGAVIAAAWGDNPFPVISGWDVSGVVEAVGDGVSAWKAGDEVFGMPRFPMLAGCYAEYVVSPADEIVQKPSNIDHAHAAGVPLAALTAWQSMVDLAGLQSGQRFLMHAAAGGVGHLAIQIAKARGAHVIGTGSARNRDFVTELGADEYIDYTSTAFEDATGDIDVQIDPFGGEFTGRCWTVMRPGGCLASIRRGVEDGDAERHKMRAGNIMVRPDAAALAEIAGLIEAGAVKPVIDTVYPLADTQKAHEHVAGGHSRGKVVLRIAG